MRLLGRTIFREIFVSAVMGASCIYLRAFSAPQG